MAQKRLDFPKGFIWGAATAGHQVEGGNVDSDWWKFEQEGKIYDGTVSGKSTDYWNRYEEDHEIMSRIGMNGFRLGIEWAKIEPREGQIDRFAIDRYKAILESLRARGMKICLTISHWVLPLWFAEKGGWTNPKAVKYFEKFVRVCATEFGEHPTYWVVLNEPAVVPTGGYLGGVFPPEKKSFVLFCLVVHRLLEAHAAGYAAIHEIVKHAADGGPTRIGAAQAYQCIDAWGTPGLAGAYESIMAPLVAHGSFNAWDTAVKTGRVPFPFGIGDRIKGLEDSYDYCGVNYYTRMSLRFDPSRTDEAFIERYDVPPGIERGGMGWQNYPPGFYSTLKDVWERFGKPIIITENGVEDGNREDTMRCSYTLEHLAQLHRAMQEGIKIEAYYHWSYIDNFEWREGYIKKLGLVECNYADPELKRVWRKSAYMYQEIIRENAITEEIVAKYAPAAMEGVFGDKWRA